MLSTCITCTINSRKAAFPFASPGPHDDTIRKFQQSFPDTALEVLNFADLAIWTGAAFTSPVITLGFRGALIEEPANA